MRACYRLAALSAAGHPVHNRVLGRRCIVKMSPEQSSGFYELTTFEIVGWRASGVPFEVSDQMALIVKSMLTGNARPVNLILR